MNFSQCTLEIDLSKIRANYNILAKFCHNTSCAEIGAVVKANSYGLGANKIAPFLFQEGCKNFFVFSIDEGIDLRKSLDLNANIFVLNGVFYNEIEEFDRYNLIPILNHLGQVKIWQEFAALRSRKIPGALHINTGINRLGMPAQEVEKLVNGYDLLQGIELQYIMSHLSSGEENDNPYNLEQLKKFKHYLQYFPEVKASLSNSSSMFLGTDYHFDLIRPGAALYGINPTPTKSNPMHHPIRLVAPIIQIQEIPVNSSVGYNMTFLTDRDSIVATLPIGYADGYSRIYSNCGEVYIDGYKAPVIGRVSMDLITIDVTNLPPEKVFLGQEVEIIGDNCTTDKVASISGIFSYEILTMLGSSRYKRIYKNHA